jgi:carbamoyl-phosphate synthase large subunit
MSLPPLKLVLTAAGCPGASTLIRMLKGNGEREIAVHGVDVRDEAIGRFLCDSFERVPPGPSDEYPGALEEVVARERPEVLFVQSSAEVGPVAAHRHRFERHGARVLVASSQAIAVCSDKAAMAAALDGLPVPQPRTLLPESLDEFVAGCRTLGYPGVPVCFKPPVAKGSRGFRILSADVDRVRQLLHARPLSRFMTLEEFAELFRDVEPFPRLMLMEYLDGPEHTVDALAHDGELLLHQTKTRELVETGVAMAFRTVERPNLVESARHACRALGLDWFVNVQFIGDALLEINPRVSTFVYQEDFILPYLGIKYALGELDAAGLEAAQARVRTSRRTVRYYDQVFWDD